MSRRHKKSKAHGNVELNMAAMLDMAFQLLTFFILTFNPGDIEGQINVNMPPPQPVTGKGKAAGDNTKNTDPVKGLNTLLVDVLRSSGGGLSMRVGGAEVGTLTRMRDKMSELLNTADSPFDQVIIQVGSTVSYAELMEVVEICASQRVGDKKLDKLSFVELPTQ